VNINPIKSLFILICLPILAMAQPANDDCGNATVITALDGTCNTFNNTGATGDVAFYSACQSGAVGNVWFVFTAQGANATITANHTAGKSKPAVALWTTDCTFGGTVAIGCNQCAGNCTSTALNAGGLTIGTTYYISVEFDKEGDYDICVSNPPPGACNTNEDCAFAEVVVSTSGNQSCVSGCTTGASSDDWNMTGSACGDITGPRVWYALTTGVIDAFIDITVTSADIAEPHIQIHGSCTSYQTSGCDIGTGGVASIIAETVGSNKTIYISVGSNNGTDVGNFDLCFTHYPDPSACNTADSLMPSKLPDTTGGVNPGVYYPGDTVQFCYSIPMYEKPNCNWLSGIVPIIGSGWDSTYFNIIQAPTSTDGKGVWSWWLDGAVTYNQTYGNYVVGDPTGAGWYYVQNSQGPTPNDSYGDGNFNIMGSNCFSDTDTDGWFWNVCYELRVPNVCVPGADLSAGYKTFADGEVGIWADFGCATDPPNVQLAVMACNICDTIIPIVTVDNISCYGVTDGSIKVSATNANVPYTFKWSSGGTVTSNSTLSTLSGLAPGTYTVTVSGVNNCDTIQSIIITQPDSLDASFQKGTSVCTECICPEWVVVNAKGGTFPYQYTWSNGFTNAYQNKICPGNYTVTIVDKNGCTITRSVTVP